MGMKQRFGIANALLGSPSLVILDEPVNGLDPQGIAQMRELFEHLHESGTTLIISSHILSELSLVATRFGVIHEGRLMATLTRSELEHHTSAQQVELMTNDNVRAAEIIASSFGIRAQAPSESDGMLVIPVSAIERADSNHVASNNAPETSLTARLAHELVVVGGLELSELHTKRQSLEDFYFSITRENDFGNESEMDGSDRGNTHA
jgi:ABC-2 type transport system ATP-binding protein